MYEQAKAKERRNRQELSEFLAATFMPGDLIETRLIETWSEAGRHQSRFVDRNWMTPAELLSSRSSLQKQNAAGANVFFGVNPRLGKGSTKREVALCRLLWADLDNARPEDDRLWDALPPPSLVVDSGRGVHLYWRLKQPVLLTTSPSRMHVEAVLQGMYRTLNSDSVQDVSRLLRLPGFKNVKDHRNGQSPKPCRLVQCNTGRTYDFLDFQHLAIETLPDVNPTSVGAKAPSFQAEILHTVRELKRIRGLLRLLTKECDDRSKRDFFVVTKLLSLGCTPAEVAQLVEPYSKFAGNETYRQRTIQNALKLVGRCQ